MCLRIEREPFLLICVQGAWRFPRLWIGLIGNTLFLCTYGSYRQFDKRGNATAGAYGALVGSADLLWATQCVQNLRSCFDWYRTATPYFEGSQSRFLPLLLDRRINFAVYFLVTICELLRLFYCRLVKSLCPTFARLCFWLLNIKKGPTRTFFIRNFYIFFVAEIF